MKSEFTPEQEEKINAKITALLNEKKFADAAKLMVAMAIVHTDPDEFARLLCEKIQEYTAKKLSNQS